MIKKILKGVLYTFLAIVLLALIGIWQRHYIIANLYKSHHELLPKVDEGPAKWFDDYYTVEKIAENTYAIGEPLYWQRNYNYLIIGGDSALLIDAGPGLHDIRPVVKSLTDLPYAAIFSHFHFDHVGNGEAFPKTYMVDLPYLRERAENDSIQVTAKESLAKTEGFQVAKLKIDEWIKPEQTIDLGNRTVKLFYTPGHTTESVSLYDAQSGILFSGDWFTEAVGPFVSNSSMEEMYLSIDKVICNIPQNTRLYAAHKYIDGGGAPKPLTINDLKDTKKAIKAIQEEKISSEGTFPAVYEVNDRVTLYTDISWLQKWTVKYPDLLTNDCN